MISKSPIMPVRFDVRFDSNIRKSRAPCLSGTKRHTGRWKSPSGSPCKSLTSKSLTGKPSSGPRSPSRSGPARRSPRRALSRTTRCFASIPSWNTPMSPTRWITKRFTVRRRRENVLSDIIWYNLICSLHPLSRIDAPICRSYLHIVFKRERVIFWRVHMLCAILKLI